MERIKLLIVEDDADQRQLIGETLEEHFGPHTVQTVASGAAALQMDLGGFDLILTDFNLPDLTGMDLLVRIHQRCETPVIMVTGENVGQIAAEAIRRGAMDYVVKFGDYLFTIPLVVEKNLMVAKLTAENKKLQATSGLERDKNVQLERLAGDGRATRRHRCTDRPVQPPPFQPRARADVRRERTQG